MPDLKCSGVRDGESVHSGGGGRGGGGEGGRRGPTFSRIRQNVLKELTEAATRPGKLQPAMNWSDVELQVLQGAVARHGTNWASIHAACVLPGRSADAARRRWRELLPTLTNSCSSKVLHLAIDIPSEPAPPPSPLPSHLRPRRPRSGSAHAGRPWDYVVRRSIEQGVTTNRELTSRQLQLIKNWQLENARGRGLLLCNLHRAEARVKAAFLRAGVDAADISERLLCCMLGKEQRDQLGLVIYPGEVGHTLTRSCAAYNWIGGEDAGSGRFATSAEIAAFMGMDARGGAYRAATHYYTEIQLCGVLAESVHSHIAGFAAHIGLALGSGGLTTLGSVYCGAFDALGSACLKAMPCLARSFIAESDYTKARVLLQCGAPYLYSGVEYVDGKIPADVLVASPPCLVYSKANRVSTPEDQVAAAREQVGQMRRLLVLLKPKVFLMEQTYGLATHCPASYEVFGRLFARLPYAVYCSPVDAHTDCEGSHHRKRLIWVAVRERDV